MTQQLRPVVHRYVDAVNAFDIDAIMATFTPDAVINDNHREFADPESIRAWVKAEIVGDRVTMEVTETVDRPGITVLRARYDGDYDKADLPDELILTNYLVLAGDRIAALFIIFNNA